MAKKSIQERATEVLAVLTAFKGIPVGEFLVGGEFVGLTAADRRTLAKIIELAPASTATFESHALAVAAKMTPIFEHENYIPALDDEATVSGVSSSKFAPKPNFGKKMHEAKSAKKRREADARDAKAATEAALEAEVASEPSIAKAAPKVDKRKSPEFIAHLRKLAAAQKEKAAAKKAFLDAAKIEAKIAYNDAVSEAETEAAQTPKKTSKKTAKK